jgi:hypothetical protein
MSKIPPTCNALVSSASALEVLAPAAEAKVCGGRSPDTAGSAAGRLPFFEPAVGVRLDLSLSVSSGSWKVRGFDFGDLELNFSTVC